MISLAPSNKNFILIYTGRVAIISDDQVTAGNTIDSSSTTVDLEPTNWTRNLIKNQQKSMLNGFSWNLQRKMLNVAIHQELFIQSTSLVSFLSIRIPFMDLSIKSENLPLDKFDREANAFKIGKNSNAIKMTKKKIRINSGKKLGKTSK